MRRLDSMFEFRGSRRGKARSRRFGDVLLVATETGETQVGTPTVEGATVKATVVAHGRGKKIVVFKMKRRKGYRRRNGHRQSYTEIVVDDIVLPN